MWRLYNLLKPAIEGREPEGLVVDEIARLIKDTNAKTLLEVIHIMYDNTIEFSEFEEFIALFINGLYQNDFFGFLMFIKGLQNGPSK